MAMAREKKMHILKRACKEIYMCVCVCTYCIYEAIYLSSLFDYILRLVSGRCKRCALCIAHWWLRYFSLLALLLLSLNLCGTFCCCCCCCSPSSSLFVYVNIFFLLHHFAVLRLLRLLFSSTFSSNIFDSFFICSGCWTLFNVFLCWYVPNTNTTTLKMMTTHTGLRTNVVWRREERNDEKNSLRMECSVNGMKIIKSKWFEWYEVVDYPK